MRNSLPQSAFLAIALASVSAVAFADRTLESESLRVVVSDDGRSFSVDDLRTGKGRKCCSKVLDVDRRFVLDYGLSGDELTVTVSLAPSEPLAWMACAPAPLEPREDDWLVVPRCEGMRYPANADNPGLFSQWMWQSGSGGTTMPFIGVADCNGEGAGYMILVETPDDGGIALPRSRAPGRLWTAAPVWAPVRGRFGYRRKVRYVFFADGGYVAMAKRYRAYAMEKGLVKTLAEKAADRPSVAKLAGATDIWWWDSRCDRAAVVEELRAAGIERMLFNAWKLSADETRRIASMPGVLVGRYDIYQDVYRPEVVEALGGRKKGVWRPGADAWPHDCVWSNETAEGWVKGWHARGTNGQLIACAVMCDMKATEHMVRYVGRDMAEKPYTARFIDTTTTVPLRECENPAHPMTRAQCREARVQLLDAVRSRWNLVVGSENGIAWAVPSCDYFEGMLSPNSYRIPSSGRDVERQCDSWPKHVEEYGLNPKYRIPLWELVFHDCVQSTWFWGDYNNKMLALWRRRDLFNVLYGTMPMFIIDRARWKRDRERFVATYRMVSPVQRDTAFSEMVDHRTLSDDFSVQRCTFANGVSVTVDFAAGTSSVERTGAGSVRK